MIEIIRQNVKLRTAFLRRSLTELCFMNDVNDKALISSLSRGNPTLSSLEILADVLAVPFHELSNPNFNPREFPVDPVEDKESLQDEVENDNETEKASHRQPPQNGPELSL